MNRSIGFCSNKYSSADSFRNLLYVYNSFIFQSHEGAGEEFSLLLRDAKFIQRMHFPGKIARGEIRNLRGGRWQNEVRKRKREWSERLAIFLAASHKV